MKYQLCISFRLDFQGFRLDFLSEPRDLIFHFLSEKKDSNLRSYPAWKAGAMDQLCDSRLFEQEAGFEPANLFRSECYLGLFPHCFASTAYSYLFEREAGHDPTTTTWQAVVLPTILFSLILYYRAVTIRLLRGENPVFFRLNYGSIFVSWTGLEPALLFEDYIESVGAYSNLHTTTYFVGQVGLEPTNSEEGGFTVRCNCHYATDPFL